MVNATVLPANPFGGAQGQEALDAIWVIICGFIIFTMQSGFGLLESGLVSRKSEANVMVKNMLDVSLGGIAYWVVGFGFSFGPNSKNSNVMAGEGDFVLDGTIDDGGKYAQYFFQLSFATTATTIVSGAVAERVKLPAYMIFAVINTGLIYVFPAHWMWDENGWLYKGGAMDFAGSSVVHMAGGAAALAATLVLGPRHGKYDGSRDYYMASPTNVVLGVFFLWWGWIGFNCGSTFAMSGGSWRIAARATVVTMNGAMAGGVSALAINLTLMLTKKRHYLIDIPEFVSGILGGLVAITASANVIRPWEALIIGFIGGLIAIGVIHLLEKLQIDDPVGCFGVHYGAGLWAMIATGLFAEDSGDAATTGIFRGGNGNILAYNIAGSLAITVWSGGLVGIVFLVLKYTIGIRLKVDEEIRGSDEVEHNICEDVDVSHLPRSEQKHSLGKHVMRSNNSALVHRNNHSGENGKSPEPGITINMTNVNA